MVEADWPNAGAADRSKSAIIPARRIACPPYDAINPQRKAEAINLSDDAPHKALSNVDAIMHQQMPLCEARPPHAVWFAVAPKIGIYRSRNRRRFRAHTPGDEQVQRVKTQENSGFR